MAANPRLVTMVLAAAAVAGIALVVLMVREPDYSVLYAGLSGEQGGRAIAELQKLNIPYTISEGGRVILVPASQLGQARLQLAARGVPKLDGDAWGLLDNESLGVSPFVEQVHYVRGLEATLARTVGEIDGVVSAKVTLALPKRTGFLADEPKPSASVMLRMAPNARLSRGQVSGVVGLVASSVPGLARDNVTVVDQDGKVLSQTDLAGIGQIPEQLAIVEQINGRYGRLLEDLLTQIVGRGNFRVTVDSDIDFSQSKQSFVRYGQAHMLSQDQTIREGAVEASPGGIPGALSNQPPQTPTAPVQLQPATPATPPAPANANAPAEKPAAPPPPPQGPRETHAVTNFDIDKSVQYLEDPPWKLRAISVAVLLNNSSGQAIAPERVQQIKRLVESVIGVGESHEVTVVDMPFSHEEPVPIVSTPLWKQPWIHLAAQNVLLAAAGLLALFGGLFPMLRWLRSRPAPGFAFAAVGAGGGGGALVGGGTVGGALSGVARAVPTGGVVAAAQAAAAAAAPAAMVPLARAPRQALNIPIESSLDLSGVNVNSEVFKIDVEAIRAIVANDPGRTAQVVKEWINRGTAGKQDR